MHARSARAIPVQPSRRMRTKNKTRFLKRGYVVKKTTIHSCNTRMNKHTHSHTHAFALPVEVQNLCSSVEFLLRNPSQRVSTGTNAMVRVPPLSDDEHMFIGQPVSAGDANTKKKHTQTHNVYLLG